MHKFRLLIWGFFKPILLFAKDNLHELAQCCLEILTIEVSLVCHVPFQSRIFRCQITDSSNTTIDLEIPLLEAGTVNVDDGHGLGNLPDTLPHLLSVRCVVKPPISYQVHTVSAADWLAPTQAFSVQTRTCRVGIWIVLASVMTDFANQKALHHVLGSQRWSMIEWWISNACYHNAGLGVLNKSSSVIQCGSRGEEGVSNILEIVSKAGMQGEYIYGLEGFSWSSNIIMAAIQLGNS